MAPGEALSLTVRTFGDAEVLVGGQAPHWQSAGARDLFFYLLSYPEGRRRDEIMADLWGLDPDAASANRFRVTVHRLRAALGRPDALTETYGRSRLSPDVFAASDVQALYRALQDAERATSTTARVLAFEKVSALYAGDYLPGVQAGWAQQAREEHRAAYVQACTELSALHCDKHACPEAVTALGRAVAADPYIGEQHHQKLMTCLSVVAGPYAAVEHYRRFLRFLRHDLNDTPLPETAELAERVKGGEPICARGEGQQTTPPQTCPLVTAGQCPAALRRALGLN